MRGVEHARDTPHVVARGDAARCAARGDATPRPDNTPLRSSLSVSDVAGVVERRVKCPAEGWGEIDLYTCFT